jgi:hypothetical protein
MKPLPQFFALLRYHAFASPWIWVFPFAFGMQPLILIGMGAHWSSLGVPLSSLTMLTIAPMFIASFVFAVEKIFAGTPWLTGQTHQQIQTFSGDFLLTRAIDRPVLFRARVALYWLLIALPFVILLVMVLWRPALEIEMSLKKPNLADFYLSHLPGAEITRTTKSTQVMTSPYGNVALAAAMTVIGLAAGAVWQSLVFVIVRFPFRRELFFGLFFGSILTGPFLMRSSSGDSAGFLEQAILWIMSHLVWCTAGILLLAVASYFFSALRDRKLEYP